MPTSSLKGKVVVITGGASGIGRATAIILANQGVFLSLADKNEAALASVKAELLAKYDPYDPENSPVITAAIDIRSVASVTDWIQTTATHFHQRISGAANLAGVIGPSAAKEASSIRNITDEEFDWVMGVNVKGTLNCMRAELPFMVEGKDGRGGGAIVNAASIAGLIGVVMNGPYVASKHAVAGLTRTAAKEEGQRAIRVNAIAPGIIDTPMLAALQAAQDGGADGIEAAFGSGVPGALGRLGDPHEAADLVVFLLSPQSSFINGVVVPIEGGWVC